MAIQSVTILANSSVVMPVWVAAMICRNPVSPSAASALRSSSSAALNGCFVFQSGCFAAQRLDAIDRKDDLDIHRLLGPQRAVVVEGGDALVERHEIRAAGRGHARDEVGDRLFHRAVVPGGRGSGACAAALLQPSAAAESSPARRAG